MAEESNLKPERWRQIEALFHVARERPEGDRTAFLVEICAGDEDLRLEVQALLEHSGATGAWFEKATGGLIGPPPLVDSPQATSDQVTKPAPSLDRIATPEQTRAFSPGLLFGPYRIERLLGRGGMGEVYSAEESASGRRVAVKILRRQIFDPADRARFLREGRLAASLSHPHTVYIFGTDEIDGIPTIAMELAPGGTLKDRVQTLGPLAPTAAVDAILQVVAGLEAAAVKGILHRDVKPSNCFVDSRGSVKVGDFGLSISTLARGETELTRAGTLLGTPAFAAPEQLRGDTLDVRADIYGVGATIYYLLSGRAPIEDDNLVRLVARAVNEVPASPRAFQPGVPTGLAAIVLRCLAKQPDQRFQTYLALEEALEPFSSRQQGYGTLGSRMVAGTLDLVGVALVISLGFPVLSQLSGVSPQMLLEWWFRPGVAGLQMLVLVAYFGVLEGFWGRSIGKRACGLRVRATDGSLSVPKAWFRAFFFAGVPGIVVFVLLGTGPMFIVFTSTGFRIWAGGTSLLVLLVGWVFMFASARRRNGYAGFHDLLSDTRVFLSTLVNVGPVRDELAKLPAVPASARRVGPYVLLERSDMPVRELSVAYDDRLQRTVWVHRRPSGSTAMNAVRRDVDRPGRLRWLAGSRTANEDWDAYEAVPGRPLRAISEPQPWAIVRDWIRELTDELDAGLADGTLTALSLDHVWIGDDGHARLLDWPTVGSLRSADDVEDRLPDLSGVQQFVGQMALSTLEGWPLSANERRVPQPASPLPLSATTFFRKLHQGGFTDAGALAADAAALTRTRPSISRWSRLAHLAASTTLVLLVAGALMGWMGSRRAFPLPSRQAGQDLLVLVDVLNELRQYDEWARQSVTDVIAERRAALETYIAGPLRPTAEQVLRSSEQVARRFQAGAMRARTEEILRRPIPSAAAVAQAEVTLGEILARTRRTESLVRANRARFSVVALVAFGLMFLGGVMSPIVFRGGLFLQSLGLVVVSQTGDRPSRVRALCRALVAWAPALFFILVAVAATQAAPLFAASSAISFMLVRYFSGFSSWGVELVGLAVFVAGGLWALRRPERGLQDRIVGTWLVPR